MRDENWEATCDEREEFHWTVGICVSHISKKADMSYVEVGKEGRNLKGNPDCKNIPVSTQICQARLAIRIYSFLNCMHTPRSLSRVELLQLFLFYPGTELKGKHSFIRMFQMLWRAVFLSVGLLKNITWRKVFCETRDEWKVSKLNKKPFLTEQFVILEPQEPGTNDFCV